MFAECLALNTRRVAKFGIVYTRTAYECEFLRKVVSNGWE
ncbi:hypothetical protein GPLA_4724 [Paraglaciecola polaris LMG 21857]|uniref:Uncharacterized protein n=1 Tax=Paraglaciecola polaris LMG 21857 TaxID=1129793 RepID=K7A3Y8_9ALTE|nr:hypothetical protein GPLA_4724 [Paraglaciecola polaris LMG 21857]